MSPWRSSTRRGWGHQAFLPNYYITFILYSLWLELILLLLSLNVKLWPLMSVCWLVGPSVGHEGESQNQDYFLVAVRQSAIRKKVLRGAIVTEQANGRMERTKYMYSRDLFLTPSFINFSYFLFFHVFISDFTQFLIEIVSLNNK